MEIPAGVIVLKNEFLSILAGIFRAINLLLHELLVKTSHFPSDGNYFFAFDQTRAVSTTSSRGPTWIHVSKTPSLELVRFFLGGATPLQTKQHSLKSAASGGLFAGTR